MELDVRLLPGDGRETDLSDTVCIVMDVFRATTSIITAIANGCASLIPVMSVDEAYHAAGQIEGPLFAGERQSIKITGFDFGNSPFEFSAEQVQDKTIIMTTTNGTIAIKSTEKAYLTLLGSFINASAVCRAAQQQNKSILLVCAGTDGLFSLEDAFCAGLLVKLLTKDKQYELTDAARGVQAMYHGAQDAVLSILGESRNGKRLYGLGLEKEVEYCLSTDSSSVVPRYRAGRITALQL